VNQRPNEPALTGMSGATRMHDPSEALHDRVRRRAMNIAFVALVILNWLQLRWIGVHGWDWLSIVLLMIAAAPAGIVIQVFELRFKMAANERRQLLRDLPAAQQRAWFAYALVSSVAFGLNAVELSWALTGIWLYDFITYYHDRPERIRHFYAVVKIYDSLRSFRRPWMWALPAVAWEIYRRL
jgi:hypothetical protein